MSYTVPRSSPPRKATLSCASSGCGRWSRSGRLCWGPRPSAHLQPLCLAAHTWRGTVTADGPPSHAIATAAPPSPALRPWAPQPAPTCSRSVSPAELSAQRCRSLGGGCLRRTVGRQGWECGRWPAPQASSTATLLKAGPEQGCLGSFGGEVGCLHAHLQGSACSLKAAQFWEQPES